MIKFNHFNFNVLDLDKSLAFYKEALGLEPRLSDYRIPGIWCMQRPELSATYQR